MSCKTVIPSFLQLDRGFNWGNIESNTNLVKCSVVFLKQFSVSSFRVLKKMKSE